MLAIAGWLALLVLPPRRAMAAEANAIAAALQSISAEQLQQCVNMLADDAFEGREAGSRGGRAACAYLGGELQKRHVLGAGSRWRAVSRFRRRQPQYSRPTAGKRSEVKGPIRHRLRPLRPRRLRQAEQ